MKAIYDKEFNAQLNKAAKLVVLHDGIHDFVGEEVKGLFSVSTIFRQKAVAATPGKDGQKKLFKAPSYLAEHDKKASKLINESMKKIREVREIHLKDHPIAGYSHRIQRGFYHKRKLMQKADGIIDDLIERGGRRKPLPKAERGDAVFREGPHTPRPTGEKVQQAQCGQHKVPLQRAPRRGKS